MAYVFTTTFIIRKIGSWELHVRHGVFQNMSEFSRLAAGILAAAVLFSFSCSNYANAAQSVGVAKRIQNDVTGSSDHRKLAKQDSVYRSESISAGSNSFGEIELSDGAKVLVGENSQVSLDDFVVSGGSFNRAGIKVAKGAFRFISGNSRKGAFNLRTPLSTIGVRGTIFDVYVRDGGATDVVLLRGRVDVCGRAGSCAVVDKPCDIVSVGRNGRVNREPFLRSPERSRLEEIRRFPLLNLQWRFSRGYHAPTATCNDRAARLLSTSPEMRGPETPEGPASEGDDY